jgi:methylenetetrahydrofolate dehydrogenase (NADP+)/methenyltetrahydrofolate cyclohydrolase
MRPLPRLEGERKSGVICNTYFVPCPNGHGARATAINDNRGRYALSLIPALARRGRRCRACCARLFLGNEELMPITFFSVGPWYSTEEAADKMGLTPEHISRQCRNGKFKCEKVGRNYILPEAVVLKEGYNEFNAEELAYIYRRGQQIAVDRRGYRNQLNILGILAPDASDTASLVYARTLKKVCGFIGLELGLVEFDLTKVNRKIHEANDDPAIHGIFVFYPIFKDHRDKGLKDEIVPHKDIEGLSSYWSKKLYSNERYVDPHKRKKAILPCTSLGILKTLAYVDNLDERPGQTFKGKKISIFNRSDVVGRPLASMLNNDGATVYSFDINGGVAMSKNKKVVSICREDALGQSDTIITGVPSKDFKKIRGEEIEENTTCLNFSFIQNFEKSARKKAGIYVPRVGPMTIAMCIRNALRLYENNRDVYQRGAYPVDWNRYGQVVTLREDAD